MAHILEFGTCDGQQALGFSRFSGLAYPPLRIGREKSQWLLQSSGCFKDDATRGLISH
jgi:hypothetical protein